jgi:Kdo2-lipid IVA lauroyltransferase/acyltransferase
VSRTDLLIVPLRLLGWLPLGGLRWLGAIGGHVFYKSNSAAVRVMRRNIALCYPQLSEIDRECRVRARAIDLTTLFFETLAVWNRSPTWLVNRIVASVGIEHLDAALATKRGVILIAPHHGNWEVVGLWAAQRAAMTSLYDPPRSKALEAWIKSARQRSGAKLLPTDVRGVAGVIKALKRGEISGILPDQQPPPSSGEFAPFFGHPARTMTLIGNLLQRTEAAAFFVAAVRVKGGWRLHIQVAEEALWSSDQAQSLAALNRGVEAIIALAPEQYQWEYKRFRAQPSGSASLYPQRW